MILQLINKFKSNFKNNTLIIGETFSGKSWLAEAYLEHYSTGEKIIVTDNQYKLNFPDECHFSSPKLRNRCVVDIIRDRNYETKANNSNLVIFDEIGSMIYNHEAKILPVAISLLKNPKIKVILISQDYILDIADNGLTSELFDNIIIGKLSSFSTESKSLRHFSSIQKTLNFPLKTDFRQFLHYTKENETFVLKNNFKLTKEDLNKSGQAESACPRSRSHI